MLQCIVKWTPWLWVQWSSQPRQRSFKRHPRIGHAYDSPFCCILGCSRRLFHQLLLTTHISKRRYYLDKVPPLLKYCGWDSIVILLGVAFQEGWLLIALVPEWTMMINWSFLLINSASLHIESGVCFFLSNSYLPNYGVVWCILGTFWGVGWWWFWITLTNWAHKMVTKGFPSLGSISKDRV